MGLGSIAIKRRTPTDSRMIPEESEGVRGPREARGGEKLKLGEAMSTKEDGIVWKEFALKKKKCQSDGGSVRGLSGSGQVWGTRKKVTEEKGQLREQACSAEGHPTRKGGRRKEEK